MPRSHPSEPVQGTLLPPEVVQLTVHVGLVGSTGHCQWQVEARSATDGELLSLVSRPHFTIDQLDNQMAAITEELREAIRRFVVPF